MAVDRDGERMPTAVNVSSEIDVGDHSRDEFLDDDGRAKRTGTMLTASAHIITAVIGSGVLSLAWATAQLGWIAGPIVLAIFAIITWYCSIILADCYRSPQGKRSYSYKDAVEANLGSVYCKFCAWAQYVNLVGVSIGYTITTAISMGAIKKSNCFHKNGQDATCEVSTTLNMVIFAVIQILLSQLPNFHKISWLSIVAAIMSVAYSSIGLGLSVSKIAEGPRARTTLTGVVVGVDVTATEKLWRTFQSLGNIAFAYSYSTVLIEIQDTLRSSPPENQVMKKASSIGVSTTTMFYMACGLLGYAAFGNSAPGNFLTGFYEPFWLIDIANICIVIHLIGAYQVFAQPVYHFIETWSRNRWPESRFLTSEHAVKVPLLGDVPLSIFRLTWRTLYVIVTAVVAMIFPFFNDFLGLIGAMSFWPLTVFLPVEMYIVRAKIPRFSSTWNWLKILSTICLLVSLMAACGSVRGLIQSVQHYQPFKSS
ncbi:amino acid permease 6-like [Zingiber officinale]|uniref:amino acid permease 6-like n=1 Tax=Zingiber officinale TaxID=94328 RepID=UPI001C4CD7B5|nr:amino acid permease 6-like [Zingiber officinale]